MADIHLKLGKMKTDEIAAWFGLKGKSRAQTFRNNKERYLRELEDYADFDIVYGGIEIRGIKNPGDDVYIKGRSDSKKLILKVFDEEWAKSGLDTCTNVNNKIMKKYSDELTIGKDTAYRYTLDAKKMLFGVAFKEMGRLGYCKYLWCKVYDQEDGLSILEPFTEEEQEIKKEVMKKYFGTDIEQDILIREMVENGELTKEEAYDLSCEIRNLNKSGFMSFKAELETLFNCRITKGTLVIRNENVAAKQLTTEDFNWE